MSVSKLHRNLLKFKLVSLLIASALSVHAQQTLLQVVTKQIEKTIPYEEGYEVNVEGEKAEIVIKTWDKNEVYLKLDLIAKHPEKQVAKKDLKLMKHVADRIGNKIYLRNYLAIGDDVPKPKSNLKARYIITIPAECPVNLNNYFGQADIQDVRKELNVNSEFCKLLLNNIEGMVQINTNFGDIDANRMNGTMEIVANRSNMILRQLVGDFDIKAKYGFIQIDTEIDNVNLNIDANKSDVQFVRPLKGFNFTLTAEHGGMVLPEQMLFKFLENNQEVQKAIYKSDKARGKVNIKTYFGKIVLGPRA